jgi:hypothetical protein
MNIRYRWENAARLRNTPTLWREETASYLCPGSVTRWSRVIIHTPVHPPAWHAQYEGYPRNSLANDDVFERRWFIGFKMLLIVP